MTDTAQQLLDWHKSRLDWLSSAQTRLQVDGPTLVQYGKLIRAYESTLTMVRWRKNMLAAEVRSADLALERLQQYAENMISAYGDKFVEDWMHEPAGDVLMLTNMLENSVESPKITRIEQIEGSVLLEWKPSNASYYTILKSSSPNAEFELAGITSSSIYLDADGNAESRYKIIAHDGNRLSAPSDIACIDPPNEQSKAA